MKNYSEMTDFEINKAVAIAQGYAEDQCEYGWSGRPDVGVEWNEETGYPSKSFNYCHSWADAGPIIQNNYLSIECQDMFDLPVPSSYWKAYNPKGNHCTDENPLRAAMIVYLMMQEKL